MIPVNSQIFISSAEVQFRFSRSSGPGGQKVNKTNSRVELEWDFLMNQYLKEHHKERIRLKAGSYLTKESKILISSDTHRTQVLNKEACVKRLIEFVNKALAVEKRRVATKPGRGVKKRREKAKSQHSDKKKQRQKVKY